MPPVPRWLTGLMCQPGPEFPRSTFDVDACARRIGSRWAGGHDNCHTSIAVDGIERASWMRLIKPTQPCCTTDEVDLATPIGPSVQPPPHLRVLR
jgi:hypothetical protein